MFLCCSVFFRINFADRFQTLFFVADLNTELNWFLLKDKEVKHDDQNLEGNLQTINASPPACRLKLVSVVWHANCSEKEHESKKLH